MERSKASTTRSAPCSASITAYATSISYLSESSLFIALNTPFADEPVFGVGGGFLIVPALLVVACVSIERALATSLVGISLIAASGFVANASHLAPGNWTLAGLFLGGSAIGMTIGVWAKALVPARALNVIFGLSVLGVAAFVILRNLSHS